MKVLHLLAAGGTGGIEILCKDLMLTSNLDNRICFLFEEGETYNYLYDNNYKVFSLKNLNRNKKKITDKLVKYCNKEQIDVVVVHHGGRSCNIIYINLRKKLPSVKFVRYLHGSFDKYTYGNSSNKLKNFLIKRTMKKALNMSDLLIFISKAVQKSFESSFDIKNINKVVIYNGIGRQFYDNLDLSKKENNRIVYVGRLVKLKGVDILIKAFKLVNNELHNTLLTIVGDGQEREKLEHLVKTLNIEDKVKFTGIKTNVKDYLDKSKIFVYPSICEEGFGISVVEAMSRGCIPIAFNKGGLPEVIEDEKNGYIVNQTSEQKLAEKIIQCLQQDESKIIQNAIQGAKDFSIDKMVQQFEKNMKILFDD